MNFQHFEKIFRQYFFYILAENLFQTLKYERDFNRFLKVPVKYSYQQQYFGGIYCENTPPIITSNPWDSFDYSDSSNPSESDSDESESSSAHPKVLGSCFQLSGGTKP